MSTSKARKRLACIRCVLDCVNCIKENKALPVSLCFVPSQVEYVVSNDSGTITFPHALHFWSCPSKIRGKLTGLIEIIEKNFSLTAHGEEFSNDEGDWIQVKKDIEKKQYGGWILLHPRDPKSEITPVLVPKHEQTDLTTKANKDDIFGGLSALTHKRKDGIKKGKNCYKWLHVVETHYMLHIIPPSLPSNVDATAVSNLSNPPPNWSLEADEELVRFLVENCQSHDLSMNGANKYVDSIAVSTEPESANNLLDGDPNTFWESDGSLGRHYIKLTMKSGVIIQRLIIGIDQLDDNYMPSHVVVYGTTESGQSKLLNDMRVDSNQTGDVDVLENCTEFYSLVEIRIKECKDDGIDCRVHYVKVVSLKQKQNGLSRDLFDKDLVRYPKLETIELKDRHLLYRRALALKRFISLFDDVIQYLLPKWEYTAGTYSCLESIRQLLPLSKKRQMLIENCLRESQSVTPPSMPRIYINRHLAAQHIVDPEFDIDAKNSVFHQLYEALRPERCEEKLDYRWPLKHEQWWECKFIGEGIIDQGGGFRDSISDIAEELCPSSMANFQSVPLPYFVRSPNQTVSSNVYRDCYVPNADCKLFLKYTWLGKIMGACLRGKENLVISLPPMIWKILSGETVSFKQDYHTVDAGEVKFHDTLREISKEKFNETYDGILRFTSVLCNGDEVDLKPGVDFVTYENRLEYLELVKEKKMCEFDEQIGAILDGLQKVVPKAVLSLMTWQELEKRVCGDPVITVEALKKSAHYEDFDDEDDVTIKYFWQAIENFTNEDRSRFLRFVTGRRRLPTPLYISNSKASTPINSLPESATCSHSLFLPNYTSAAHAEEKLRYAVYNCITIDADMGPWEE